MLLFAVTPPIPSDRLTRPHQAAFPAALYLILASADLIFSLVAFALGVAEGNPFMAWLLAQGFFVPGKILVSLMVAALMLASWRSSRHRSPAYAAARAGRASPGDTGGAPRAAW